MDEEARRAERQRQFSRRELLRAGMSVPALLSIPAVAAACGGGAGGLQSHGDHTDSRHGDHTDASGSSTTQQSTQTTEQVHGDAPVHSDVSGTNRTTNPPTTTHSDTTTTTTHVDTPHVDTPHADTSTAASSTHQDSGGHIDTNSYPYQDVAGPPHQDGYDYTNPTHIDSGPHTDTTVTVPSTHEDTPHGDQAHADGSPSSPG